MTAGNPQQAIAASRTTRQIAAAYFATWAARDAQGFRGLLADDVTWSGPTWTAANAEECMTAFRAAAGHLTRIEVKHVENVQAIRAWASTAAIFEPAPSSPERSTAASEQASCLTVLTNA